MNIILNVLNTVLSTANVLNVFDYTFFHGCFLQNLFVKKFSSYLRAGNVLRYGGNSKTFQQFCIQYVLNVL